MSILTTKHLDQLHTHIIKTPKPHVLNPFLKFLTHSSTPRNALLFYNQMLRHPTAHNHFTFTHALQACSLAQERHKSLEIHARLIKSGQFSDVFIQNSLLYFYLTQNDVPSARKVFSLMLFPDVVSWTTIISGLSKRGFAVEAIKMFCSMDVKPNSTTLVSVLSACSRLRAIMLGKAIHGYSLRKLDEDNMVFNNAILDFYVRCGCLVSANYLFVNMPKRDVVSWTTMVGGYAQNGFCEEAVGVFQDMLKRGEAEPNEATLVTVLSACSAIGSLSLGQTVHDYISTRCDLLMNHLVGNALINMYVKCGHVGMAVEVFNALACKDIISWGAVICGMAMNGCGNQALQLFSLMLIHGVAPDDVTFIGLLSACSHAGLVDHGLMLFKAMSKIYGVLPQMQHYACMVDLYGRAGLLEEAESVIREMPVEAEGPVWGALLNACKIHGNEKMFERIRQCLPNSRGVSIGTLALLSNTYAISDKWDDANKVRDAMRDMGLKKMAGCSWIEVEQ